MEKSIHAAPARLQRMILQLQSYNLKLVHVPGKQIPLLDTLSRKFLPDTDDNLSKKMEAQVHQVIKTLEINDRSLQAIKEHTVNHAKTGHCGRLAHYQGRVPLLSTQVLEF